MTSNTSYDKISFMSISSNNYLSIHGGMSSLTLSFSLLVCMYVSVCLCISMCECIQDIHCADRSRNQSWHSFVSVLMFCLVWNGVFVVITISFEGFTCMIFLHIRALGLQRHTLCPVLHWAWNSKSSYYAFVAVLLHSKPYPQILSMDFTFSDISSYELRSRLLSPFIPSFPSTRSYLFHRPLSPDSWQNQVDKLNFSTEP